MAFVTNFPANNNNALSLLQATVQLGGIGQVTITPEKEFQVKVASEGLVFQGVHTVLRYLGRRSQKGIYESSNVAVASQVDEWLDSALQNRLDQANAEGLAKFAETLENYLQLRTVLAGYKVTIADLAIWYHLKSNAAWESFAAANQKKFVNFWRWFDFVDGHVKRNSQQQQPQSTASSSSNRAGSQGSFSNLELPNAKMGEMVTRFPPEPSGYLHIGHAKAALLNNYYAQAYQGKLIIRFDDTNPDKEKEEYVDSIIADLETLGVRPSVPITYTSDYFDALQKYAEELIKSGQGYIDDTPVDKMREERGAGIESKHRNDSIEENLRRWNEMKNGTEEGLKCVLRAKIDMQQKNKVLRDPSLYRCSVDVPHHRTGTKYKVYPLYDFACPIVDSLEGVTHALRSSEYHDRNPLYYWVVDALKLRKPYIQDFSRLNFSYTLLSKRKLQWIVDQGVVKGWNDPRFPTIRGMIRRGLTMEALREFILSQGASKSLNLMQPEKLWALNKKILDPIVPRYTAVAKDGKVLFTLEDGPATTENRSVPKHKKNPDLGNKVVSYTKSIWLEKEDAHAIVAGEEVTLMDWGNAFVDTVSQDANGQLVLKGRLNLAGSVKNTKKKLTWLPQLDDLVEVTLVRYENLISKEKLDPDDKLDDIVNRDSKFDTPAVGDPSLRTLNQGDKLQLERRGYFICDSPYLDASKPMVLIEIPDGHTTKAASVLTTKPAPKAAQK